MKIRALRASLFAPVALVAGGAGMAQPVDPRINEIQIIGTHNSYVLPADPRAMKLMAPRLAALHAAAMARLDAERQAALAEEHPNGITDPAQALDYIQMPIEAQLRMGVRSLELDLNPDPVGGTYADPLPYRELRAAGVEALAPIHEAVLREPGMKVLHVADVDFRSQCPAFRQCLTLLRQWSDANPGHSPVFILLEPKFGGLDKALSGAAHVPPFDDAAFDEVDAAIRNVLGEDRLFTPDMLRGKYPTLEAAALAKAWPRVSATRGKFLFLYLVPGLNLDAFRPYMEGRPSLEGRAVFVQGLPGMAHAAFVLVDNALARPDRIPDLVQRGYMVRSRADIDTGEARRNDTGRRERTLASGAHVVSTDYLTSPNIYGNDYHVAPFANGWRCNPVAAPCSSQPAGEAMKAIFRPMVPALLMLALAGALPQQSRAMAEAGYRLPVAENLESRNFPLLTLVRAAPGWTEALRADKALGTLGRERQARVDAAKDCKPRPACLVDAWVWTPDEIAIVDGALRRALQKPAMAKALVTDHMRASGHFALHAPRDDAALLSAAWTDTAAAMNRLLAVYGKGEAPLYPKIDSIIFDVTKPDFAYAIEALGAVTQSQDRDDDLIFDASLRYALGLLMMNERIDAATFLPVLAGDNAATAAALPGIEWSNYPYAALLVFGHGPEDAQSRTGVMGHLRLRLAADQFARGQAPVIIVSGGNVHPNRTAFNEAVEMKNELIAHYGVSADRILIEPHARHTTTNLRNIARMMFMAGIPANRDSLIVSDPATVAYIGGKTLADRNIKELGYQPGRITSGPSPLALRFRPDPVSLHVDARDPLDP